MTAIKLSEGSFLHNCFGKYEPNLSILTTSEVFPKYETREFSELNIEGIYLSSLRGDYFVSKKGTNCFRVKEDGKHYLYCHSWHGRNATLPFSKVEGLYYRCASSNGGGNGYDYIILPVDWKYQLSEEDI